MYIFTLNNPLCRYLGNFENSFPGPENKKNCLLHGICTFLSLEVSSNKNTELFRPLDATSTGDGSLLTKVHGCDARKRGKTCNLKSFWVNKKSWDISCSKSFDWNIFNWMKNIDKTGHFFEKKIVTSMSDECVRWVSIRLKVYPAYFVFLNFSIWIIGRTTSVFSFFAINPSSLRRKKNSTPRIWCEKPNGSGPWLAEDVRSGEVGNFHQLR